MAQATITDETAKMVTKADGTPWYDLDGTTVLDPVTGALGPRVSPYGVGAKRAIYATFGGIRRTILIKPSSVVAVVDPTQYDDSDLAAVRLEQKVIDQAAINAANLARDNAVAALGTAQAEERERIALAAAAEEAARIRAI